MAWKTSITGAGTIIESKKYITNTLFIILSETSKYTQTRVITVTRFPGLTQSTAETEALARSANPNVTDVHTEYNGAGAYTLMETVDIFGDWTLVPPPP